MAERILEPGEKYYGGGTFSKRAGKDGLNEADKMAAAMYAPNESNGVYKGGTFTGSGTASDPDRGLDSEGRELFK